MLNKEYATEARVQTFLNSELVLRLIMRDYGTPVLQAFGHRCNLSQTMQRVQYEPSRLSCWGNLLRAITHPNPKSIFTTHWNATLGSRLTASCLRCQLNYVDINPTD